jgi:hypothetical protein
MNRFTSKTKSILDETYPEQDFPGMEMLSTKWVEQVTKYQNDYRYLDFIKDTYQDMGGRPAKIEWHLYLKSDKQDKAKFKLDDNQKKACNKVLEVENNCAEAFQELQNAVSPFQFPFSNGVLVDNGNKLKTLQSDWRNFIDNARYQTPLDVWFTTLLQGDRFNGKDLVGPPNVQWFLLRPTIVYEHLDDVETGNKDEISLAVEWAGVNFWRYGFGLSATSTYRDQKDVSPASIGLTFHIKNKYSFGVSHRKDGGNSLFFNIDLLEWFGENKEKYKKYKKYL